MNNIQAASRLREIVIEADNAPTQAYARFVLAECAKLGLKGKLLHVGESALELRVIYGHANTTIEMDSLGENVEFTMPEDDLKSIPSQLHIKGQIFEGATADLDDMPAVMAKAQSMADDLKAKYLMLGSIIGDYAEMYERIGKLVVAINPKD